MPNIGNVSKLNINGTELSIKDSALTDIVNNIIDAIGENNEDISEHINNLNEKSFDECLKYGYVNGEAYINLATVIGNISNGIYKLVEYTNQSDSTITKNSILIQYDNNTQYAINLNSNNDSIYCIRHKENNVWSTNWINIHIFKIIYDNELDNIINAGIYVVKYNQLNNSQDYDILVVETIYPTQNNNDNVLYEIRQYLIKKQLYRTKIVYVNTDINSLSWGNWIKNDSILSNEYEMSNGSNDNLNLSPGDTYEEAFGKIEKSIIDNEKIIVFALTNLDKRLNDLHSVASSGNYNDLNNKPTLAQVATSGSYNDLSNKPTLSQVATSGSYNDLSNKPTLSQVATSGDYDDLSNKPTLSQVATSGDYDDLANKPSFTLSNNYAPSTNSNNDLFLEAGDTYEEAFGKLEKNINDNELAISHSLNDLNTRINSLNGPNNGSLSLSNEYATSSESNSSLRLQAGDTHEEAFSKLEKAILDNEQVAAQALTDLNDRLSNIESLLSVTSQDNGKILMVVNGQWQLVSPSTLYSGSGSPNNANGNNGDLFMCI